MEHRNANGEWIDDMPRDAFERLAQRYVEEIEGHLCEVYRERFRDLVRLYNAQIDKLRREAKPQ